MIVFIAGYLLIQIIIGYWISKKIKNSSDFFLAGRHLSLPIVAVSLVATWYGAETCIGSAGAVYADGLSGSRADPFGYSLCLLLMGLFIAAPLWRGGYITLGDFFAERYGHFVEKLTVLILVPGSIIWAAAQIRAFGQIVSSATQLPMETTIMFCTVFIVGYTFLGGLLGDVILDVFKGIMITVGLVCMTVAILTSDAFSVEQFLSMSPERFNFIAPGETLLQRMDRWAIPILGSLVAQELVSRTLAAKSAKVATRGSYIACAIYLVLGCMPVFLGLVGPMVLPNVPDREHFLTLLAHKFLPASIYVIFIGALISAILSTIDTILLSISAIMSQNIAYPFMKRASDAKKLNVARLFVILAAICAYAIAHFSSGIYALVEMASSFGTSGLLIITLLGIWTKFGGPWAGATALIVGAAFYNLGDYWLEFESPFLSAILASLIGFIIVGLIEKNKGQVLT